MQSITKRDPLRNLFGWPRWMDEFEDVSYQKGLKVRETDKDLVIEAVVAGVPMKDINIDLEDGVLTIKAEKTVDKEKKDEYKSSSYQYYYTCALSGGQWNKAQAEYEDGVLTITIPKAESARPKKIAVKAKTKKK